VTILLVIGVVLVVFGGLVLLLFPDRPGGKLGWQGFEVSSVGAGLPVIVVGVVAVGFAALHGNGFGFGGPSAVSASSGSSATAGCLGKVFHGIPAARESTLEVGASADSLVRPGQPVAGPVGLRLTDGGKTVGGIAFSYFEESQLIKVAAVVDAGCKPVSDLLDVDSPSRDPLALVNWDTLRMRLQGRLYYLRLGSAPQLEGSFTGGAS
jgi:hypothetical protein